MRTFLSAHSFEYFLATSILLNQTQQQQQNQTHCLLIYIIIEQTRYVRDVDVVDVLVA